jgi:peptidoglycan-associated lipoprotein
MRTPSPRTWLSAALAAGMLTVGGCATEEYVDEHIAVVNGRIQAVEGNVEGLSRRVGAVEQTSQQALQRAEEAHKLASGKFVYAAIGEPVTVTFDTAKWTLSDEAQATLTAFAEQLRTDNRNVYVDIIGYADARGETDRNRILGEKRALEVRRFLYGQGVPLNRMVTASWGELKPAVADDSAAAHDANRRVTVTVMG